MSAISYSGCTEADLLRVAAECRNVILDKLQRRPHVLYTRIQVVRGNIRARELQNESGGLQMTIKVDVRIRMC